MANIPPSTEGSKIGTWGELPWTDCVRVFEIDAMCRTEERPTVQSEIDRGGLFPDQVVIRLKEPEAGQHGTAPGYFLSPLERI